MRSDEPARVWSASLLGPDVARQADDAGRYHQHDRTDPSRADTICFLKPFSSGVAGRLAEAWLGAVRRSGKHQECKHDE